MGVSRQVIMKGDLVKLSSGILSGWQKRYFVLFADGRLCYYKKQETYEAGEEANSEVNLKYYRSVEDITVPHSSRKNIFMEAGEEENSEINLRYYCSVENCTLPNSDRRNVFRLSPKPMDFNYADIREFQFAAETITDMDMWIGAIFLMIEKYQDLKLKMNKTGQVTAESHDSVELVRA